MTMLAPDEVRALKAQAMMVEKGGREFTVRLGVTGGHLQAGHLRAIAALAEQYGAGDVHLTTRQGVEIPHVPYERLAALREALEATGLQLAPAGRCVRGITACPGGSCPRGFIDSQRLAQRLRANVGARGGLPHKFKIAVSGCPNGCTKPTENDLGVMGSGKRFVVFVGGKMGKHPRCADRLPFDISDEDHLLRAANVVIDWYAARGNAGERFGATLDRVGLASLVARLEIA